MPQAADIDRSEYDAVIDAASLHQLLEAGAPVGVLDCRHDLAQPDLGREQYRMAHIPGAVFAHLDQDLSGPKTGSNGRHPLPERSDLAERLRGWGVGAAAQVVAYDASEGCYAARAWWLLRWLGHAKVAVLDGGWPAWLAAGYPTSQAEPTPQAGDFRVRPPLEAIVDVDTVAQRSRLASPASEHLLIDARAPDRYEGRTETIDAVAGHIPGAVNRFWKDNLTLEGRFKPPDQLRLEYGALLAGRAPSRVVLQCGSGVTACHDLLAMYLAGLAGAALFPGSWSQWIADPSRPIRLGPAP